MSLKLSPTKNIKLETQSCKSKRKKEILENNYLTYETHAVRIFTPHLTFYCFLFCFICTSFLYFTVESEQRINTLKGNSDNSLAAYSRNMPGIVYTINQVKHKFKKLPRGPIGSYLKIKDRKWAVAVEAHIGPGMLRSFLVDNKEDSNLLLSIFNKYSDGRTPSILTSKFVDQVYDISRTCIRPVDGCISIYDALDITDCVVANSLIDNSSIEQVLLVPSGPQARQMLSNVHTVPNHCKMAVIPTGDKYYPAPSYKCYATEYTKAQYIQISTDDIIK